MHYEKLKLRMRKSLEDRDTSGIARRPFLVNVVVFSLIACLGAFLMGFNEGYATQTLDELNTTAGSDSIKSSAIAELSAFNAIFPVGALIGGLFAGWASDTFGRKPAIVMGALPQLVGWLAISVAHFVPYHAGFLSIMLLGRFLCGLGAGWNSLCVPVYITEISPVSQRGFFGSWNQLFVCVGYLVALSLGIPEGDFHYYYVSLVAVGINILFVVTMLLVDESPAWLFACGKSEKAVDVLSRLRGPHADLTKEIDEIKGSMAEEAGKLSLSKSLSQLRHCSVVAPFLLSIMLMFFMQFGGINALAYYASQQLQQAQVPDYRVVSSMTVGGTLVLFALVGLLVVERFGRKTLLVISSAGMMVSCFALAADFYLVRPHASDGDPKRFSPLAIIASVVYNASFSLGWGPLPWVMMSELVPTSVRGLSTSIATALNWGFVAMVTFGVTYYELVVHPYGAWFTFGGIMLASIFCVAFLLPETRGRTMDEIQEAFESFSYRRYLFPERTLVDEPPSEGQPLLFDSKVGKGLQYM